MNTPELVDVLRGIPTTPAPVGVRRKAIKVKMTTKILAIVRVKGARSMKYGDSKKNRSTVTTVE
jgi:hypothetical protein